MKHIDARTIFPSYIARQWRVPEFLWTGLRLATLIIWVGMAGLLILDQETGLFLLWKLIVPLVPALLVVAPGLWRQVCPMASFNQMPRLLGFSLNRTLPETWRNLAFLFAVFVFFAAVCLRHPVLNHQGTVTGSLLLVCLGIAFLGGFVFKGRSGWCGTFCPLGPIQRAYGHAPAVNIPQTFCKTCVGCQKNCYDFNPVASQFDELWDEDPRYAGQRRFFMGMLPGFILAYFLQTESTYGYDLYLALMIASALVSVGLYVFATNFLRIDPYVCASGFASAALIAFYWFAGPMILSSVARLSGTAPPPWSFGLSQLAGVACTLSLLPIAMQQSKRWRHAEAAARQEQKASAMANVITHDVDNGHTRFTAIDGQLMLESMGAAGLPIVANCKAGLCGSDAFAVLEGADNLSPPTEDELSTLKRLGLEGKARLACSCRVFGPVKIASLAELAAPSKAARAPATLKGAALMQKRIASVLVRPTRENGSSLDAAVAANIRHVVVIGNGVAGVTAADELRKVSPSVRISLVSVEERLCYNRMALNKILEGKSKMQDLILQQEEWYEDRDIELMMGVRAESIDRVRKRVVLDRGPALSYDRLVLATGARANVPDLAFISRKNCFVMRTTDDAEVVRHIVEKGAAKHAIVFGAGVLGIETAESLVRGGIKTTLIGKESRVMERQIDAETSAILQNYLTRLGLDLRFGASLRELEGEVAASRAIFSDGSALEADLYIACIGVTPNTELARQSGIATARGILVDPGMRTSDPDIFAIGDAAELSGAQHGLWQVAIAQARTAIATMLGKEAAYNEPRTIMRLKSSGVEMRISGSLAAQPGDEVYCAPPFGGQWWRIVVRDQIITGAVYIGSHGRESPLWDLVRANVDIGSIRGDLANGDLENAAKRVNGVSRSA